MAALGEQEKRIQAQRKAVQQASRSLLQRMDGTSDISNPWDGFVPEEVFTAKWSDVRLMCPVDDGTDFPQLGDGQFGFKVAENWICDGPPKGQVSHVCRQTVLAVGVGCESG